MTERSIHRFISYSNPIACPGLFPELINAFQRLRKRFLCGFISTPWDGFLCLVLSPGTNAPEAITRPADIDHPPVVSDRLTFLSSLEWRLFLWSIFLNLCTHGGAIIHFHSACDKNALNKCSCTYTHALIGICETNESKQRSPSKLGCCIRISYGAIPSLNNMYIVIDQP